MPAENTSAVVASCRGLRGATVIADGASIEEVTLELCSRLLDLNGCALDDVAAIVFTLSDDLAGVNPAAALRANGFAQIALLMVREHAGATLARCLRVLMLVNTSRPVSQLRHVYLRGAEILRADLVPAS